MKKVYLGLGSNMGNREDYLRKAVKLLRRDCGEIVSMSRVYETDPVGIPGSNSFLNMVVILQTDINPAALMKILMETELSLGRIRSRERYSSRTIDIDILLYDDEVIDEESLIVPHPRMHERRFVLVPLSEIAPDAIHPVFNNNILTLLEGCTDKSRVTPFSTLF